MKAREADEPMKESAAEKTVLEVLIAGPRFGIEVARDENRTPGDPAPVSEALGRCLAGGWVRTGAVSSPDWRMHLTDAGGAELARRKAEATEIDGTGSALA
jgi:hypothetical protein